MSKTAHNTFSFEQSLQDEGLCADKLLVLPAQSVMVQSHHAIL